MTIDNEEVLTYDIVSDRDAVVAKLAGSDEIDALTSAIDVYDMNTIVTFGSHAAEAVSRASDALLRDLSLSRTDGSNELMAALGRIMAEFDPDELEEKPSLLGKLFGDPRKRLDKVLGKYRTLGDEVDRVYIGLRKYETEIKQSNQKLEEMFRAGVETFHELEKYIVAGEQGCREIEAYIGEYREKLARTGDQSLQFEIQTLENAGRMLEQRTHDLKLAEAVAMQSIPMIRLMQFNNMNLARKINSTFIVTLPVFKQALAQAILLKRQSLQAEALSALDKRTGEMLRRNGQGAAIQGPAQGVPALRSAQRTILDGIGETRRLHDSAMAQRAQDQARLEEIKKYYLRQSRA